MREGVATAVASAKKLRGAAFLGYARFNQPAATAIGAVSRTRRSSIISTSNLKSVKAQQATRQQKHAFSVPRAIYILSWQRILP